MIAINLKSCLVLSNQIKDHLMHYINVFLAQLKCMKFSGEDLSTILLSAKSWIKVGPKIGLHSHRCIMYLRFIGV